MKRFVLALIAPVAFATVARAQETARPFDGAEVARLAAVYEKTAAQGRYETGQELAESQYFKGFVIGVALTGAKLGVLCPPEAGVNFRALWTSTATWLREHPDQWTQGPEEVVMAGLREAYPCASQEAPPPDNLAAPQAPATQREVEAASEHEPASR